MPRPLCGGGGGGSGDGEARPRRRPVEHYIGDCADDDRIVADYSADWCGLLATDLTAGASLADWMVWGSAGAGESLAEEVGTAAVQVQVATGSAADEVDELGPRGVFDSGVVGFAGHAALGAVVVRSVPPACAPEGADGASLDAEVVTTVVVDELAGGVAGNAVVAGVEPVVVGGVPLDAEGVSPAMAVLVPSFVDGASVGTEAVEPASPGCVPAGGDPLLAEAFLPMLGVPSLVDGGALDAVPVAVLEPEFLDGGSLDDVPESDADGVFVEGVSSCAEVVVPSFVDGGPLDVAPGAGLEPGFLGGGSPGDEVDPQARADFVPNLVDGASLGAVAVGPESVLGASLGAEAVAVGRMPRRARAPRWADLADRDDADLDAGGVATPGVAGRVGGGAPAPGSLAPAPGAEPVGVGIDAPPGGLAATFAQVLLERGLDLDFSLITVPALRARGVERADGLEIRRLILGIAEIFGAEWSARLRAADLAAWGAGA